MKMLYGRLLLAISLIVLPHSRAQSPAFEVASVKPTHGGAVKIESDPGRLTISDEALDVLIRVAFGLREYQYQGPAWLHTTRYDIVATTASPQPRATQLAMLRSLLIERFKLMTHQESKMLPVYALVVGKGGPKLRPIDVNLPTPFELYSNFSVAAAPGTTRNCAASAALASSAISSRALPDARCSTARALPGPSISGCSARSTAFPASRPAQPSSKRCNRNWA